MSVCNGWIWHARVNWVGPLFLQAWQPYLNCHTRTESQRIHSCDWEGLQRLTEWGWIEAGHWMSLLRSFSSIHFGVWLASPARVKNHSKFYLLLLIPIIFCFVSFLFFCFRCLLCLFPFCIGSVEVTARFPLFTITCKNIFFSFFQESPTPAPVYSLPQLRLKATCWREVLHLQ